MLIVLLSALLTQTPTESKDARLVLRPEPACFDAQGVATARWFLLGPFGGIKDIPTNTSLWLLEDLTAPMEALPTLYRFGDPAPVPMRVQKRPTRQGTLVQLSPEQPLEPEQSYTIHLPRGGLPTQEVNFRTGASPDEARPKTPVISELSVATDRCENNALQVLMEPLEETFVFYLVEDKDELLVLSSGPGQLQFMLLEGEQPSVRAVAMDLAGNRSVPSIPFEPAGCTCAGEAPRGSWLWIGVLLGAGLVLRRLSGQPA